MATIPSLALIPSGYKASKVYSVLPTDGTGDFTFTRSGNATRVNSDGLIELVSTNVPRLNYPLIDGVVQGCPSLLLEPSRTNLVTFSEQFDNAAWVKSFSILTSNAATSPDGYTNADKLIATSVLDGHIVRQPATLTDSTNYSLSVFAKAAEYDFCRLQPTTKDGTSNNTFFNLVTGVVASTGVGHTATIEDFSNGWYRCTIVYNAGTGATTTNQQRIGVSQDGINQSFLGNDSSGIYIWGAMLEAGSYATSYIPTQGASATRVAETCNQTTPSGIIGQTEGTIFAHFKRNGNIVSRGGVVFLREDFLRGLSINYINNTLYAISRNDAATTTVVLKTPFDINETAKVAITYNGSVFSGFLNGVKIFTDSVFNPFDTIVTEIRVSYGANSGSDIEIAPNSMKDVRVYTTVLTDQECINLTTL
jgi:hypothetical protein